VAAGPGRDQVKAMERLVRILAVLNEAGSVGATAERLFAVAEYGGDNKGDQLSLDLRHLRKQGWQIEIVSGEGEAGRYRMVSGDNRLRLKLSPAQLAALQRAVILSKRADLAKTLGIKPGSLPHGVGSQVVPREESAELSLALQAVQLSSRIRFSYKGTRRLLHPGTVRLQNYHWYLSGIDVGDDRVKHYAVSRMSNASLDKPDTAQPVPEVRRIPLHPLGWDVDPPVEVTLRTTPDYVPDVERWLMAPKSLSEHDGIVDLTYTVTNSEAFRARIYVLGPRITIIGPDQLREEILADLHRLGA